MNRQTDLAWAAGFIDGEGTFGVQRQGGKKDIPYLQASQVDRQVLDRLASIIQNGKVYGPYTSKNPKDRPYYYYRLTGIRKTIEAGLLLLPYLSEIKHAQFNEQVLHKFASMVKRQTPPP